jgi:cytochrome c-type biogenesis protein CcmE
VAVLAVAVLAGVALLAAGAMKGTLTYYETPTDLVTRPPSTTESVRVGGLVTAGTVRHRGPVVRFVLTDGAHDLDVVTDGTPPSTFRGGAGAVVEGHVGTSGVFHATRVLVRHSNEYHPPRTASARSGTGAGLG